MKGSGKKKETFRMFKVEEKECLRKKKVNENKEKEML